LLLCCLHSSSTTRAGKGWAGIVTSDAKLRGARRAQGHTKSLTLTSPSPVLLLFLRNSAREMWKYKEREVHYTGLASQVMEISLEASIA
jgi:hypothetical protein